MLSILCRCISFAIFLIPWRPSFRWLRAFGCVLTRLWGSVAVEVVEVEALKIFIVLAVGILLFILRLSILLLGGAFTLLTPELTDEAQVTDDCLLADSGAHTTTRLPRLRGDLGLQGSPIWRLFGS